MRQAAHRGRPSLMKGITMNVDIETPCPFCGHDAQLMNTLAEDANDDPPNCHVYCPQCLAQGPSVDMDEEPPQELMEQAERKAIAKWNHRQHC